MLQYLLVENPFPWRIVLRLTDLRSPPETGLQRRRPSPRNQPVYPFSAGAGPHGRTFSSPIALSTRRFGPPASKHRRSIKLTSPLRCATINSLSLVIHSAEPEPMARLFFASGAMPSHDDAPEARLVYRRPERIQACSRLLFPRFPVRQGWPVPSDGVGTSHRRQRWAKRSGLYLGNGAGLFRKSGLEQGSSLPFCSSKANPALGIRRSDGDHPTT